MNAIYSLHWTKRDAAGLFAGTSVKYFSAARKEDVADYLLAHANRPWIRECATSLEATLRECGCEPPAKWNLFFDALAPISIEHLS